MKRALLTGLFAAVLTSCSEPKILPTPSFNLSLSSAALSLKQNENGNTTVNITNSVGLTVPITLSLEGAPAGVNGTFDPTSVTGNSSVLTLSAGNATPGDYALKVVASSGTVTQNATLNLNVSQATITVQGRVLAFPETAVADAKVVIPGHEAVRTNALGEFSVPNVTTPYSLLIVKKGIFNSSKDDITVYESLTTATPVAFAQVPLGIGSGSTRRLTVRHNADCTGVTRVIHYFSSPGETGSTSSLSCATPVPVQLSGSLGAQQELRGALYTIISRGVGEQTTYQFARTEVVVSAAQTGLEVNASVIGVDTKRVTVQSSSNTNRSLRLNFAENLRDIFEFESIASPDGTTIHFLPVIPGVSLTATIGTVTLGIDSRSASRRISLAQNQEETINIDLPAPLTLLEPANEATDVDIATQALKFSSIPQQMNLVFLAPASPNSTVPFGSITVVTPRAEIRLSEILNPLGLSVPSETTFLGFMFQFSGLESAIDLSQLFAGLLRAPAFITASTSKANFKFTTKP